jgi:hypothetical protein
MTAPRDKGADLATELARCEPQIQAQGFVIVWKPSDPAHGLPPFAYTVGLTERYKKPELIVFGFAHDDSLTLLSTLVRIYLRPGLSVPIGEPITRVLAHAPVIVKSVVPLRAHGYAQLAIARCTQRAIPFQIEQVVIPDAAGRFPWDHGFDKRWERVQPRLFE